MDQPHEQRPAHDRAGGAIGSHGRRETEDERLDRKWTDQLQELRVMQTGAQLTAGFLLTLPFHETFDTLDALQRAVYLALVVLAVLTTALVLGPVAVHRRLTGKQVKERIVSATHWLMAGALACLGLLVTGITFFVFDVVVGRTASVVAGGALGAAVLGLLVVLPNVLARADDTDA